MVPAAAASLATAASHGNRESGAITGGPPSCVVVTDKLMSTSQSDQPRSFTHAGEATAVRRPPHLQPARMSWVRSLCTHDTRIAAYRAQPHAGVDHEPEHRGRETRSTATA